jgi:hypothetical protein
MTIDAEPLTLMPLTETLLQTVFQQQIRTPDAEAGLNRLVELVGGAATPNAWHAAVAEAVAVGLIHDPVRLPPGALQCHWHLELTLTGVATAWRLRTRQPVDEGSVS